MGVQEANKSLETQLQLLIKRLEYEGPQDALYIAQAIDVLYRLIYPTM